MLIYKHGTLIFLFILRLIKLTQGVSCKMNEYQAKVYTLTHRLNLCLLSPGAEAMYGKMTSPIFLRDHSSIFSTSSALTSN